MFLFSPIGILFHLCLLCHLSLCLHVSVYAWVYVLVFAGVTGKNIVHSKMVALGPLDGRCRDGFAFDFFLAYVHHLYLHNEYIISM